MPTKEKKEKKDTTNVKYEIKDDILTIKVDLTKDLGLSKSKKSNLIATTHGLITLPETDITVNLNVTSPVE